MILLSYATLTNSALTLSSSKVPVLPSPAKRIPRPLTLYNETIVDQYHWMHQLSEDPDVLSYIEEERKYTKAWIKQSGIKKLQKQLNWEIASIQEQSGRINSLELDEDEMSTEPHAAYQWSFDRKKPRPVQLEGTQFWDLDRWRYWLDSSTGDFGVYKRRHLPRVAQLWDMMDSGEPLEDDVAVTTGARMPEVDSSRRTTRPKFVGGCGRVPTKLQDNPNPGNLGSGVEVILDVDRLAKSLKKQYPDSKFFAFGSIEIQPKYTVLGKSDQGGEEDENHSSDENLYRVESVMQGGKPVQLFMAFTFDLSGDERYTIRIAKLGDEDKSLQNDEWDSELVLDNAGPDTVWVKHGRSLYLYYTKIDDKGEPREVWRVKVASRSGKLGTTPGNLSVPECVMAERNARNVVAIRRTSDSRFVLIESSDQVSSHTFFLSVDAPRKGWNLIRKEQKDVFYTVEHHSGYFYIKTNVGEAQNFKVVRIPVAFDPRNSQSNPWERESSLEDPSLAPPVEETVIEYDPRELIAHFEVFVEHFVSWIWQLIRLTPYNPETNVATALPGVSRNWEEPLKRDFYSTKLVFSNSSFVQPWAVYEFDMHSLTGEDWIPMTNDSSEEKKDEKIQKATRLLCQEVFPLGVQYGGSSKGSSKWPARQPHCDNAGSHDAAKGHGRKKDWEGVSHFKEMRLMVNSTHGSERTDQPIRIPVSLVYYDLPGQNFPRPAFVSAYGAYGTLGSAMFKPAQILPLLHRGLIYVEVYPRGEGNLGQDWYRDGKLESKRNTFYDVEDVLLHLRDSGMVSRESVVIEGRSAGGLISGWIANRWGEVEDRVEVTPADHVDPTQNIVREMVKVVLTQVPFVDVISDMVDSSIGWVEYEWNEWGSPLESEKIFEVMKSYSPYDRVQSQPYPAMMIQGGLTDSRVSYAEPLKWVAKLRSIDGKTNDCQSVPKESALKKKMCADKDDTPLLLQMEDGGHFSGDPALWMAFGLHQLGHEDVVTSPHRVKVVA
ncbi:hypothetical protein BGW38_010300 [Lunasporangiospora selenospora]|uniref:Prolyl endopeptidase-like n=1 Tax=Lunasporangiospora selenospora TaxID=979761 RepID=A0A9P6KID9_9FUNG|nr:hypothetical protein BGW38_010300 [Lunasporangiospora selenospora]